MRIAIIAAMTRQGVIGCNNKLPWQIKEELQYFKEVTMGKPIIMGSNTFCSIGKSLPGRLNIVISSKMSRTEGVKIASSIDEAITCAKEYLQKNTSHSQEIMVIGGANIYQQFLPLVTRMYLSIVQQDYPGDTYFPEYDKNEWQVVSSTQRSEFTASVLEKIVC